MSKTSNLLGRGASVAIVGLGNIGSQTAALLVGHEGIESVMLIDPDRYEAHNLGHQRFSPADVGRRKVDVQARSLRRMAPHLQVRSLACAVESVPLGALRGCVILACVDSRIARQSINSPAVALGVPWIDAALDRDGQVRSRIYAPGGDCLECSWGERDYELLEQRIPCAAANGIAAAPPVAATAAPQELGALAAALQVSHLRRWLAGNGDGTGDSGRQWFFDARSGRGWVGTYAPNPLCLLEHQPWQITRLARSASDLNLHEALSLSGADAQHSALSLRGQTFVRRLRCPSCGVSRQARLRIQSRLRSHDCRKCGGTLSASATDVTEELCSHSVAAARLYEPLSAFGLVDGDIFSVRTPHGTTHFQLAGLRQGDT